MTHRVTVTATKHSFEVAADETVITAAIRQGVRLPYGCRNGACGSCKGRVESGEFALRHDELEALSAQERSAGYTLFCQTLPHSDLLIAINELEESGEIRLRTITCKTVGLERLSSDVMLLQLKIPEADRLHFLAGQYIDIIFKDGHRRAFSMANAPHNDELLEFHIRLVPDGTYTPYIFDGLKVRDILRIEGPHGGFYLREESKLPMIMVAGGTGLAPIKAILEHAFNEGVEREISLYWGVRTSADLYLDKLLRQWAEAQANFSYLPVLSEPESSWSGRSGWVHEAVVGDFPDLTPYEVYMAGPPPMIVAGRETFAARGLPAGRLYFDSFESGAEKGK